MNMTPMYMLVWAIIALQACRQPVATVRAEDQAAVAALQKAAQPLQTEQDISALINEIGDSRYVLLGEASHGTAEFYAWRATITRRLIQEKGFTIVGVEGDWPDAYEVNQYIQGRGAAGRASEVLQSFNRWPTWMWANTEIARLTEWMRTYNTQSGQKAGFYGLDVYSLWKSLEQLRASTDTQTAALARQALQCFEPYRNDEQAYAAATLRGTRCNSVLNQLLTHVQAHYAETPDTARFNLLQNAWVAVNAEQYYSAMVRSDAESWNIRDRHMAATLDRITQRQGPAGKVIVWAHNTHVGDARYTDMLHYGMTNLGQLVRESHQNEGVYIVGFGTYQGTVVAASRWEAPLQRMTVPVAQAGSWDALLHQVSPSDKLVMLRQLRSDSALVVPRGQRAIGVVYNPSQESGNYVPTRLTQRYDGYVFIDRTQALTPLNVPTLGRSKEGKAPVGMYALLND